MPINTKFLPATLLSAMLLPAITVTTLMVTADGTAGEGCTPPPNEECDRAVVFTTDDLPFFYTGPLGCVNDIVDKPYMDIFFRYDSTCSGEVTFDMCDSAGDTFIRIYTGACGWSGGTEFAVNDDGCPGSPPNADPMLTVSLEAGTTYWIELGTWRPDPPWAPPPNSPYLFNVTLCTQPIDADVNDDGLVNVNDLIALIAAWGPCGEECPDTNGDGQINVDDIINVIGNWS